MILTFVVRNQTITYVDTKVTPRVGSSNYLQLRFIYTSKDWDTLRKTLHISSKEYSEPFVLESNVFDVPKYYTQQSTFNITLLGDDGQVIVPTNVVTITLDESNNLWTSTPPDAQNSAYITLLNSLGNLEDLDTKTKENIVDAINEVYRTSGVSPEDIAKAVEDYLTEHPAASASMRVEGGYIQFSGDGETWENVIAPADLKGPKGDTGAGMDITGATVGQIARISAVDDNGVPTEWEPADMASAGSETMNLSWKHIRDVELTPDAIEAIVSTTDAGNTFSYDEIMLELIPNLAGYFYVRASQSVNLSANVAMWVTNSKYTQMHLGLLGKKLAITSAFRTDGSLGFSNNYGGNGDIDKISTIVFGASASVGAAFTVKIWGR